MTDIVPELLPWELLWFETSRDNIISVCSSLPMDAMLERVRLELPHPWHVADFPYEEGTRNPCQCHVYPTTHTHYILTYDKSKRHSGGRAASPKRIGRAAEVLPVPVAV